MMSAKAVGPPCSLNLYSDIHISIIFISLLSSFFNVFDYPILLQILYCFPYNFLDLDSVGLLGMDFVVGKGFAAGTDFGLGKDYCKDFAGKDSVGTGSAAFGFDRGFVAHRGLIAACRG